jgi:hypothetical protein
MKEFLQWFFTSEMSFDFSSQPIKGPPFLFLLLLILIMTSCIWVARDASKRGKTSWVAVCFVLLAGWPFSLLWWRWLRPELPGIKPPPMPPA